MQRFESWYRSQFPKPSPENPDGKPAVWVRVLVITGLGAAGWAALLGGGLALTRLLR